MALVAQGVAEVPEDDCDVFMLWAMGVLAPVAVPRSLLRAALDLSAGTCVHDELEKALDELSRLSLIEVDTSGNPIAHRLILAFAPHRNVADSASPFEQCRAAIQAQMDRASLTPAAGVIRDLEPLLPHAESVLAGSRIRPEDVSRLAGSLGMHYHALGRYSGAKRLLREALGLALVDDLAPTARERQGADTDDCGQGEASVTQHAGSFPD